jgi:hypothetical protein
LLCAGRVGTGLGGLQDLRAFHCGGRIAVVGLEFLAHRHGLGEIDVGGDRGTQVFPAHHGLKQFDQTLLQAGLHLLTVLELMGVQPVLRAPVLLGQQGAGAINHAHGLGVEVRHAGGHQVNDAGDLSAVQRAPGVHGEHDRGGGLLLLAEEAVLRRQRQVHTHLLDGRQAADRAHEFALGGTLHGHAFAGLGLAEFLGVQQLIAHGGALGQAQIAQLHAQIQHLVGWHQDGAAAFAVLVGHVHLRQLGQYRAPILVGQAAEQDAVITLAAAAQRQGDGHGRKGCGAHAQHQQGLQGQGGQLLRQRARLGDQRLRGGGGEGSVHGRPVRFDVACHARATVLWGSGMERWGRFFGTGPPLHGPRKTGNPPQIPALWRPSPP